VAFVNTTHTGKHWSACERCKYKVRSIRKGDRGMTARPGQGWGKGKGYKYCERGGQYSTLKIKEAQGQERIGSKATICKVHVG
jgi:hypothetical protein